MINIWHTKILNLYRYKRDIFSRGVLFTLQRTSDILLAAYCDQDEQGIGECVFACQTGGLI